MGRRTLLGRLAGLIALSTLVTLAACVSAPAADSGPQFTAITGVRVYPSPYATPIDDAVIVISGGIITDAGPRDEITIPPGAVVIARPGAVALAGFWNSHVHLTTPAMLRIGQSGDDDVEADLEEAFTRWGFTTVFDLASTTGIAQDVSSRITSGRVRGPRILSAGDPFYPENATPIYARPFYEEFGLASAEVATAEEAVARVRQHARSGNAGIKLFTGSIQGGLDVAYMPPDIIRAIVEEAGRLDLPVFTHPSDREGLERAVAGGVRILAHAAPLMGSWDEPYAQWLAGSGTVLIPTLALFEAHPHPLTPVDTAVQQTRALHAAGGTILFGTDAGFTNEFDTSSELRLLEQAIGWQGVLASLTTAPSELFGEGRVRGQLAPGYAADIVIVCGDPAARIEHLADVLLVMRGGQIMWEPAAE